MTSEKLELEALDWCDIHTSLTDPPIHNIPDVPTKKIKNHSTWICLGNVILYKFKMFTGWEKQTKVI